MYECVCAHGRGSCIHVSSPFNELTGMGLNLSHLMKSIDLPPRTLRQRAVHLKAHNVVPHSYLSFFTAQTAMVYGIYIYTCYGL